MADRPADNTPTELTTPLGRARWILATDERGTQAELDAFDALVLACRVNAEPTEDTLAEALRVLAEAAKDESWWLWDDESDTYGPALAFAHAASPRTILALLASRGGSTEPAPLLVETKLREALRDLLDNMGGHSHWREGGSGGRCETCERQHDAAERARAALASAGVGDKEPT